MNPRFWIAVHHNNDFYEAAADKKAPPEVLRFLADQKVRAVRWRISVNPATPSDALSKLAGDEWTMVRKHVAANKNTPSSALARLAHEEQDDIRAHVAQHVMTPPETLSVLGKDDAKKVRQNVAFNHSTPPATLAAMAVIGEFPEAVSSNPNTPPDTLERLVTANNLVQLHYLVNNFNTPLWVIEQLKDHPNFSVKAAAEQAYEERTSDES